MHWRNLAITALAMAALALAGCSGTEKEVSQSVMPAAINYYVLIQETARLRTEVKSLSPERLAGTQAKYRDILSRGQQMHAELAQMGDLRKHQDFMAALDSSLVTQLQFLQYESQAVAAMFEYGVVRAEIDRIEMQIRGNSLARARHQSELNQLNAKAQAASGLLESLKPYLLGLSGKNLEQMRRYNSMVLERKILTYTASEDVLGLLSWEKARPPAKARSKRTASKSRSSGK